MPTTAERPDLGRTAARGAAATITGQAGRLVVQLAGIVLLARLLTPVDVGYYAMVIAVVGVGEVLRDFGLSSASVQAATLSTRQRSTLFWLNTGIGLGMTVACWLAADLVAAVYDRPEIAPLVRGIAVLFLLNGLATQYRASLYRALRFTPLAVIDVGAAAAALGVAALAGLGGAGPWALVAQQLVVGAVTLVALLAVCRWWPDRPAWAPGLRPLLSFGANVVGTQLLGYVSRNVDSLVVGRAAGPRELGFYDRAFQLLVLPVNQVSGPASNVSLPVLSGLRDDRERYDRYLLRGQSVLVNTVAPLLVLGAALAHPLVEVVLGERWLGSVPLFQVLAIGGIAQAPTFAAYWVFLSRGLVRSNLRFALVTRPLLTLLVVGGIHWGVGGVAAAYSAGLVALWPASLWWLSRVTDGPWRAMLLGGLRAIGVHALGGVGAWVAADALAPWGSWAQLLGGALAMAAVVAAQCALVPAVRRDAAELAALRGLVRR